MLRVMVASEARGAMSRAAAARIVRTVLQKVGMADRDGELSIAFIGPKRMREINRTYHGEDRVTDVLAFPVDEYTNGRESTKKRRRDIRDISVHSRIRIPPDFGEILICPSHVRAQAKRAGEPFRREVSRALIHGALHLVGYDHARPRDAEGMFSLQEKMVHLLSSRARQFR